ncbi:MAG: ribbon-helix-helix protein, CopG family [Thermoleophilia bacterium]
MPRNRVAISVSLPPDAAAAFDRIARREKKTRSALMREMLSVYQQRQEERELDRLQHYGAGVARDAGILTEEDVERIVLEDR